MTTALKFCIQCFQFEQTSYSTSISCKNYKNSQDHANTIEIGLPIHQTCFNQTSISTKNTRESALEIGQSFEAKNTCNFKSCLETNCYNQDVCHSQNLKTAQKNTIRSFDRVKASLIQLIFGMCMQYKNQSNDSPADESTPLISTTNADLHSIDIDDLSVSVQNAQIAEQDRHTIWNIILENRVTTTIQRIYLVGISILSLIISSIWLISTDCYTVLKLESPRIFYDE
ncbi:hypothetical protein RTP6_007486 [Batrachochytrium dendrobatidis]